MNPGIRARLVVVTLFVFCAISLLAFVAGGQTLGEALNATNLTWATSGIRQWTAQTNVSHDGVAAARTGFVSLSSGPSLLQTTGKIGIAHV